MQRKMFAEIGKHCLKRSVRGISINASSTWDLVTAVCVERLPIVAPPLTKLQKDYSELLHQIELEGSMKSNHEIRHEHDLLIKAKLAQESTEIDFDAGSKLTAQDFEDSSAEELSKFQFASIETDADVTNNLKSLERALQSHLVLVTQQKLGKDLFWMLPQGIREDGETLRQTAERVCKVSCGDGLKVQFFGNAPCGFYKYKYPSGISDKVGAKVFFYYARYSAGDVSGDSSDVRWLTRRELEDTLPQKYSTSVSKFLVEERSDRETAEARDE